jgi:hypothetical protein
MTEPTLAETLRRMENIASTLTSRMADLAAEMKEGRREAMPRELAQAWRDADRAAVGNVGKAVEDLEKRGDADAAWRRQMLLGLGTTILMSLVTLAVALISFIGTR